MMEINQKFSLQLWSKSYRYCWKIMMMILMLDGPKRNREAFLQSITDPTLDRLSQQVKRDCRVTSLSDG